MKVHAANNNNLIVVPLFSCILIKLLGNSSCFNQIATLEFQEQKYTSVKIIKMHILHFQVTK